MKAIKEIKFLIDPASKKSINSLLRSKGYSVCALSKAENGKSWRAVINRNKDFMIATVFTRHKEIAGYKV